MKIDLDKIPGWEGRIGPFRNQYSHPHVYARDVHSGAGNCVCGRGPRHKIHPQVAPGFWNPDWRPQPTPTMPAEAEWDRARTAWENVRRDEWDQATPKTRMAITALGTLIGIHDGHGEE